MEHWHFYCDEAGSFETIIGRRKSIICGMLIKNEERKKLSDNYNELIEKYNNGLSFHGKESYKNSNYQLFLYELIKLTAESKIQLFKIRYGEDLLSAHQNNIGEAFACNRYLYMMQTMIEHILFLHPEDYNKDMKFSFHPNSRVFPVSQNDISIIESMGFECVEGKEDLVRVWDDSGIRILLNRIQVDYSCYSSVLGKREISSIEMPIASRSNDPFVHWIDNITGVLMWENNKQMANKLSLKTDSRC